MIMMIMIKIMMIMILFRVVNIQADHLAPVVPSRGDKVKVILGDEDKDMTGQLLSIDSQVLIQTFEMLGSVVVTFEQKQLFVIRLGFL